jgi:hypothetical protein
MNTLQKKMRPELGANHREDPSKYFKCGSCGKEFDSLGDMKKHMIIEHMQKVISPNWEKL